jgi:hypothetical protein
MLLDGRPLDVDPSGAARYLVLARFVDAAGRPTDLVSGGDVEFVPSRGNAQWQTRLRFGGPAAIVSVFDDGPLVVRVRADVGSPVPETSIATDTRRWAVPRRVARALGPHSVWLGWFPVVNDGSVRIARRGGTSSPQRVTVSAPASAYRDETVAPGTTYRYDVLFPNGDRTTLPVRVPAEAPHGAPGVFAGKGMWLSFSPSTLDDDGYDKLHSAALVARAHSAGLRSIDLRTAYGPFREITNDAAPTIDAVIDGATARGIAPIAWTVPRSASFEDLEAEVWATEYRTANRHGFTALAVDLERGGYYLGSGAAGYAALATYLRDLRAALGPDYPILATVEDPFLEHLTDATYPYEAIAAQADVLQPMVYWRMMSRRATTPRDARAAVAGSYAATLREAKRLLPVNVGLQSTSEGPFGAPSASEIAAAVSQSRSLGAAGVAFFDWNGTSDAGWRAIGNARW